MMIKRLLNSAALGGNWDEEAIAYAFTSFSAAAIHNIFIIYYVDLFMNVHQLDQSWFFLGETIYMLWNSINDPLFGWLLESWSLAERINAIKYGGIAWSLSLLLIFLPSWSSLLDISSTMTGTPTNLDLTDSWKTAIVGLHFALSICLYDGVLSLVLLTHGALLADIAVDSSKRAKINTYSSLFSVVGSNTVLVSQLFWSSSSPSSSSASSLSAFRTYTLFVAFISSLGFIYTAHYLPKYSCSTSLSLHSKVLTATGEVYHPSSSSSSSSLASSPSSTSTGSFSFLLFFSLSFPLILCI
jgi:Na+/melibiose symporter-like transporter